MSVWQAKKFGLKNFSILCSHVLVPPAMEAICRHPKITCKRFLPRVMSAR